MIDERLRSSGYGLTSRTPSEGQRHERRCVPVKHYISLSQEAHDLNGPVPNESTRQHLQIKHYYANNQPQDQ